MTATHSESLVGHAVLYVFHFGLSIIPMKEKKPVIKWKELQERRPTMREIFAWPKEDIAIVTGAVSNLVVIDCESREDALWFWNNMGQSPVQVQTKRGFHFYFRHPGTPVSNGVQIHNRYDVRGDGGYVLAPPSRHANGQYRFVQPMVQTGLLPVFNTEWRPPTITRAKDAQEISDGAKYISRIVAVAGEAGHNATFRAVCRLQDADYSEAEAYAAMLEWNRTNAEPPWQERDLLRRSATFMEEGYEAVA